MKIITNPRQKIGQANPMLYGHFLEHFQRQIYGGVYDPASRFADEDGFRTDVLEAIRSTGKLETETEEQLKKALTTLVEEFVIQI